MNLSSPDSAGEFSPERRAGADQDVDHGGENAIDVALMSRVTRGDEAAFTELVERHQQMVYTVVARMLANSGGDVEDITQQVFIRVWKSAVRYQPSAKFTTWLFTITRNLVYNETRRLQRKRTVSRDEKEEDSHWQAEDLTPASRPDESIERDEFHDALDKAIESLPESQRLALMLRRHDDMPYEDIAVTLKVSVPAVKSILFRARTQLRHLLRDWL